MSHGSACTAASKASKPTVCAATKARSTASASSSSTALHKPVKSARSPPITGCTNSLAIGVALFSVIATACCGWTKPSIARSRIGFTETIEQPRRLAFSSSVSIRGWFVPGFWPMTQIWSARPKSSSVTVPLPTPIDAAIATPLLSWHMFEQSGKLFVPSRRPSSW